MEPQATRAKADSLEEVKDILKSDSDSLAERIGLSLAAVKKIVSALSSAKMLERVGSKKTGKWIVRR